MRTSVSTGGVFRTFQERLMSGFGWNFLSAVALQGSVLLSSIIVARLLGLVSFGAYSVLITTVMTIATVAQGGTGLLATKFVGEGLAYDKTRVARVLRLCRTFTLVTGGLSAIGVLLLSQSLATGMLGRPDLEPLVRIIAVAIFFQVSVSYQYGALQGFGVFKELSRGGVIAGTAYILLTVVGAWGWQLKGALIGFALASALRAAIFGVLLHRVRRAHGVPDRAELDRTDVQMIWQFALPTGLAGFITMPCLWLVTIMVARQPDGLALVGILLVAHQIRLAVLQLPSLLNVVSFSVLSRLKGEGQASSFRSVFWSNLWLNLIFASLACAFLLLFSEPVLGLYGSEFTSGKWVLVLLVFSIVPELLATSFYQIIQSAGRMWHSLLIIAIPRDLLYLALASIFVSSYGALAAAGSYLVAHTVGLFATLLTTRLYAGKSIWTGGGL